MLRFTIFVLLVFVFSGCMMKKHSTAEFDMNLEPQTSTKRIDGCKNKNLKIAHGSSPIPYMLTNMNYVDTDGKIYSYTQSKWQDSPANFITSEVLKNIRENHIFKSVLSNKTRSKSEFLMEVNIENFMQYFDLDAKSSHVEVVLTLNLIDTKTNSAVATQTFSTKVKSKTLDAAGGVKAYKKALLEIFSKNIEWFEEVCR